MTIRHPFICPPFPLVHSSVLLCDLMYTVCPFICPILSVLWPDLVAAGQVFDGFRPTGAMRARTGGEHARSSVPGTHTCPSSVVSPRAVIRSIRQMSNPRAHPP